MRDSLSNNSHLTFDNSKNNRLPFIPFNSGAMQRYRSRDEDVLGSRRAGDGDDSENHSRCDSYDHARPRILLGQCQSGYLYYKLEGMWFNMSNGSFFFVRIV